MRKSRMKPRRRTPHYKAACKAEDEGATPDAGSRELISVNYLVAAIKNGTGKSDARLSLALGREEIGQ